MPKSLVSNGTVINTGTIYNAQQLDGRLGVFRFSEPLTTLHVTRIPFDTIRKIDIFTYVSANPGVYVLQRKSDSLDHKVDVYLGESGNCADRIASHFTPCSGLDFEMAFVISSDGVVLNKGHVRALEYELFPIIGEQPGVRMANKAAPKHFEMTEYDKSLVRRALPTIIELLAYADFPMNNVPNFYVAPELFNPFSVTEIPEESADGLYVLRPARSSSYADLFGIARKQGDDFVLLPGSQVRMFENGSFRRHVDRIAVLEKGRLIDVPGSPSYKRLTTQVRCQSARMAASALTGAISSRMEIWECVADILKHNGRA